MNEKVARMEALIAVLADLTDLPTTAVARRLLKKNIRSYDDFIEVIQNKGDSK